MADDRPVEDPADALGRLQRQLDDFQATVNARLVRSPTGDIEATTRATAKQNTLICNGQLVSRTTYPDLWQWVQDNSQVVTGLYTNGDGSTTFGLPDFRGRIPIGVGTLGADTYALGQLDGTAKPVITTAQMPAHGHSVSVTGGGNHDHEFTTESGGDHGGHNSGSFGVAAGGDGATAGNGNTSNGNHSHHGFTGHQPDHTHTISQSNVGSGAAFDVRQPSIAINWLVWT